MSAKRVARELFMNTQQIAGGLWGLLVGDALGVPYEFHAPESLPPRAQLEMTPPLGFQRAHAATPPGTWSDDGAQSLCLLASLLECDGLNADDLARKLLSWQDDGYMAVDRRVFDVGIATSAALSRVRRGMAALDAGGRDDYDNGNGSLMRVLPLALWHRGDDVDLVNLAMQQSRVTHGHLRAQLCCAFGCLWARELLNGEVDAEAAWETASAKLRAIFSLDTPERYELDARILANGGHNGSGYVVDTLRSSRFALQQGDYEAVVKAAIALGHDTDTTACVAGGLAGIRDGASAIPERWMQALRERETVTPLLDALLARS